MSCHTPSRPAAGRRTLARTLLPPLAALAAFFGLETLFFSSAVYGPWVYPDSTSGIVEITLYNERHRARDGAPQVLTIGDSRMGGFRPRYTTALRAETGYTFATLAVPGTTPRCWYYLLREIDPSHDRYAAIVIGMDGYEDEPGAEDLAARASDLNYLIGRLGPADALEFSRSYPQPAEQWSNLVGVLLKGTVYQRDLLDFIRLPKKRIDLVELYRLDSHKWFDDFEGTADSMAAVHIDWAARTLTAPASVPAGRKADFERRFLGPRAEPDGKRAAYNRLWLTRIAGLYAGSRTRVIFSKLPRGPFVRPDQWPVNPDSVVRELARTRPNVLLTPADAYASLERPELFTDEIHLNGPGSAAFSPMLARQVRALLNPAEAR